MIRPRAGTNRPFGADTYLQEGGNETMASRKSKGTLAALKAWETRRANEAFAKRSAAAKKAAATRRRNARRAG